MVKSSLLMLSIVGVLAFSPRSQASGCGSYDSWLSVEKVQPYSSYSYSLDEFEIVSQGDFFISIRIKNEPDVTLTLPLQVHEEGTLEWSDVRLIADDVVFSEGNGCGPIYICTTGRYVLKVPSEKWNARGGIRVFSWPVLREYIDDGWPHGWVASDLIKPFSLPFPNPGESDLPQCVYGEW